MTDTNEMRKLLAAATPLPWRGVADGPPGECIESASLDEVGCPTRVVDASSSGMEGGGFVRAEDMRLVVAATNGLPAMLDELDAAREAIRSKDRLLPSLIAEGVAGVIQAQKAEAEVERLRDMLARLCAAVDYSAPRYGVDEDWADIDTLRLRMDEAKALLAKHKETNQ
ncbi:MAG: hypothetical protein ACK52I_06855 [Pseudomonadota bacterium]|jgi:hypothetical protein